MDWLFKRQGNKVVLRDQETGMPKKDENNQPMAVVIPKDAPQKTWRTKLRKLTNNGELLDEVLMSLAGGEAYEARLPDGRKSEPIVPSPEVRRAAAVDLLNMLRGKPVSQTEVGKAEEVEAERERLAAFSDDALAEAARPYLEVIARKKLDSKSKSEDDADE